MDENVNKKIDTSPVSTVECFKILVLTSICVILKVILPVLLLFLISAIELNSPFIEIISIIFSLLPFLPLFIYAFNQNQKQNIRNCCRGILIIILLVIGLKVFNFIMLLF